MSAGEIHALLGPNGAGKTTLIRCMTGLVTPEQGEVLLMGRPIGSHENRATRTLFGLVPSGDRTFYLRISGIENLIFFGRLYGLSRRQAFARATDLLEAVDLASDGRKQVGLYSQGMKKRLSLARALLLEPPVLLIDEATENLDPQASQEARALVVDLASRGSAVVWTTHRVDEIRGFADRVTVLDRARVRFSGTVPELMGIADARQILLHVSSGDDGYLARSARALEGFGVVEAVGDSDGHLLLSLRDGVILGAAVTALTSAGVDVLACREERSGIELAFLELTREHG